MGGGFWMLANTHRNIRIHCATSDIFTGIHHFMPLGSARFYFSEYPWGLWIWGFFWVPWWCQLKLVGCGSTQSTYVLTQGNGKGCFESIQTWFDNISK